MPLFVVQFEDAGFIQHRDLSEVSLSSEFLNGFNEIMVSEGNFPPGVVAVKSAYATSDDNQENEEDMRFFLPIELVIEAASEDAAGRFDPPVGLLTLIADGMPELSGADLQGNWEVMEIEAVGEWGKTMKNSIRP